MRKRKKKGQGKREWEKSAGGMEVNYLVEKKSKKRI